MKNKEMSCFPAISLICFLKKKAVKTALMDKSHATNTCQSHSRDNVVVVLKNKCIDIFINISCSTFAMPLLLPAPNLVPSCPIAVQSAFSAVFFSPLPQNSFTPFIMLRHTCCREVRGGKWLILFLQCLPYLPPSTSHPHPV